MTGGHGTGPAPPVPDRRAAPDWLLRQRVAIPVIPASPDTIAAFVDDMAAIRAPATVRRYLATLAVAHRAAGRADTLRHPLVKLAYTAHAGIPAWAALSAAGLTHAALPRGVERLVVAADFDGAGLLAAEQLERRARAAGLDVRIHLPDRYRTDWADVLTAAPARSDRRERPG